MFEAINMNNLKTDHALADPYLIHVLDCPAPAWSGLGWTRLILGAFNICVHVRLL